MQYFRFRILYLFYKLKIENREFVFISNFSTASLAFANVLNFNRLPKMQIKSIRAWSNSYEVFFRNKENVHETFFAIQKYK